MPINLKYFCLSAFNSGVDQMLFPPHNRHWVKCPCPGGCQSQVLDGQGWHWDYGVFVPQSSTGRRTATAVPVSDPVTILSELHFCICVGVGGWSGSWASLYTHSLVPPPGFPPPSHLTASPLEPRDLTLHKLAFPCVSLGKLYVTPLWFVVEKTKTLNCTRKRNDIFISFIHQFIT